MTKRIVATVALLIPLTVSGAQTNGASEATLTVHKSYDKGAGFGTGTRQEYFLLPGGVCKGKKKIANFSWITGASKVVSIPAGRPVTLWTVTTHFTPGINTFCQHAATFTPTPRGRYDLALNTQVWSGCEMTIRDGDGRTTQPAVTFRPDLECKKVKGAKPIGELMRDRR